MKEKIEANKDLGLLSKELATIMLDVPVDFNEETGFVKNITIEDDHSMGDVQAGIEFIYHMREHLLDISVATVYLFTCYAFYLWLKKVIK